MIVYEIPSDYVLDPALVNNPIYIEYLAWCVGQKDGWGLWWIAPVVEEPSKTIEELLPLYTNSFELVNDTSAYGYTRASLPMKSLTELEQAFLSEVVRLWH